MTDKEPPTNAEDAIFETDTVQANLAVENGQGLGAREIAAQRDPGGVSTPDEIDAAADELEDDSVSGQGRSDDTRGDATP